jgi:hypothetical protein
VHLDARGEREALMPDAGEVGERGRDAGDPTRSAATPEQARP